MEPIVHKLKRILRDRKISHQDIAERTDKHRTFITRKLNGDSMETRLLEQILEACDLTYQDLVCPKEENQGLRWEIDAIKEELSLIKESLPEYQSKRRS